MKLNYSFSIRNVDKTREKHQGKIEKVLEKIPFNLILDSDSEQTIVDQVQQKLQQLESYGIKYDLEKQKDLKQVKTLVNYTTRNVIGNILEYLNFPRSWDTAYYVAYYEKTNKLMEKIVREYL